MISPRRYFPWKIVRHYALRASLFYVLALVGAGYSIRYYAIKTFLPATDMATALAEFDVYLSTIGLLLVFIGAIYVVWSARLYFYPMGRMIQRARELRKGRIDMESGSGLADDFSSEEPGEWADLERGLERIHSDLRQKTDQLAREREELAALISAVANAILAIDRNEEPLFFNSSFAVLFGVKAGSRHLRIAEIFRSPQVLEAFRGVLNSGVARTLNLVTHTAQYPAARHFALSVAPLRNKDDQKVYGAVGIFHDVTEMKQAEQIRIEFVGNASHELRTPLTTIKGYVETLKDDVHDGRHESLGEFLEVISKNVDRLILLLNDLLDLSQIESGGELQKTAVNPREVTESVLRQLESKRSKKKLSIRADYGVDEILANAGRVEQVLMNLVHNAVKYIPEGREIQIQWSRLPSGETQLIVRDNGPGISAEHQMRIFERFYRVDPGRSRDQGGTGLGLSIVKHIMLKHGGSVQLQSRLGEGAEFTCRFPTQT